MIFQENRKLTILLSWAVVILWMAFIFALSDQPREQSNQLSTAITEKIANMVEEIVPHAKVDTERLNHVVRKNAHFFAYLVLGMLLANGLKVSGMKGQGLYGYALLVCILYAVSDEVHQLFVPGRGCRLTDVLIDAAGAGVGIMFYTWLRYALVKYGIREC